MSEKRLTRRHFLRGLAAAAGGTVLAACAPQVVKETVIVEKPVAETVIVEKAVKETVEVEKVVTATPVTVEGLVSPENMPGSPDHVKGWTTILPKIPPGMPLKPPIHITQAKRVDSATRFIEPDTIDDSVFTRFCKEAFGIEWEASWTWVTNDEREQKYNLAMAAGDLPDVLETVNVPMFKQMVEANMLEDITEAWEQADELWLKSPMEYGDGLLWTYAEINGRKMGVPNVEMAAQNDKVLFIHQDWLDKLGLQGPKTLDDLYEVGKAFKEADLGQGTPGSTVPLGASNGLATWAISLDPIFGAFGVQPQYGGAPGHFSQTPAGELGWDGTRSEMKEALVLLRKWYADGILAADFFTKTAGDVMNDARGNLVGMHFSQPWTAEGVGIESMQNDPNARWTYLDVPSGPAGRGKYMSSPVTPAVWCFRKGFEYVDEVLKQAAFWSEIVQRPEYRFHGWEGHNYEWQDGNTVAITNAANKYGFGVIYKAGGYNIDPTFMENEIKFRRKYGKETPRDQWDAMMELLLDDPTGMFTLKDDARLFVMERTLKDGLRNEFMALPTTAMSEYWTALRTLTNETYYGIITGDLPVDAFDEFVEDWKAQGGDKCVEEANDWWAGR